MASSLRRRRRLARAKSRLRRPLGSVIIFALTVLTPILVAGGTVLTSLKSYSEEVERRIHSVSAQLIAASGAHQGLATVSQNLAFRGTLSLDIDGGRSAVDVTQIAGDKTADLSDDLIQIRSEGWLNGPADGEILPKPQGLKWYRSVVTATVRPRLLRFPIEQTLFLADPSAQVLFSGSAFRVSGIDSSANGKPPLPGIGLPGDPHPVATQIPPFLQPYITGEPATTTASVLDTPAVNLKSWIDRFHHSASVVWTSPTEQLDTCQLGTDTAPVTAFAEGALTIKGNVTGSGILVVTGDLKVSGALDYSGIILVGGSAFFRSPGLLPTRQRGALLVGGSDNQRDLEITGDVQIKYDSSVLDQLIGQYVDGVELVTWNIDLDASVPDADDTGGAP